MANNIRNLKQVDHVFNYAEQHPPQNNTSTCQIACRLCNRVLMSNQALITHIESHMAQEEVAIRRLHSPHNTNSHQRELNNNIPRRFPPNLRMPMLLQEPRNFPEYSRMFQEPPSPPQPMVMPQLPRRNPFSSSGQVVASQPLQQIPFPPQVVPSAGNNVAEIAQFSTLQMHQRRMEESPIDGTKAYINQLEKPIKRIEFIDLVGMDDDNSDFPTLNLALKL